MSDILESYKELHDSVKKASDGKCAEIVTDYLAFDFAEGAFIENYCLSAEEKKELEIFRTCPEIGLLRSENEFIKRQIAELQERLDKNNKIIESYKESMTKFDNIVEESDKEVKSKSKKTNERAKQ